MFRRSLRVRHNTALCAIGPLIVLLVFANAGEAFADSCRMTATRIAAVAILPDPITPDAAGAFVRDGKVMGDEDVENMCLTRRYYDLVLARQAAGRKLKASDVNYYAIEYMTAAECILVRHESNLARRGGIPESPKDQTEYEDNCKAQAGLPLAPSL